MKLEVRGRDGSKVSGRKEDRKDKDVSLLNLPSIVHLLFLHSDYYMGKDAA